MSTRRTYEAVARALKGAREATPGSPPSLAFTAGVNTAAMYIAEELAKDHPGFDTWRFLNDAGVTP